MAASVLRDLLAIVGAGSVSYGAWLVYQPAGFITGGAILMAAGIIGSVRGGAPKD